MILNKITKSLYIWFKRKLLKRLLVRYLRVGHIYIYIYIYVCVCVCVYVCMYVCMYVEIVIFYELFYNSDDVKKPK